MVFAPMPTVQTPHLVLRAWREEDLAAFARLNQDPRVMEFLPSPLSREASDAMVERIQARFAESDRCLWAVEVPGDAPFVGYVGLSLPRFDAPFMPATEIGWRLAAEHWGKGYATEAARAALAYGFDNLGLEEIVSFTVPANVRSRAVMERIGMVRHPADDFDHPLLPEGHPLRLHVLYRVGRARLA